MSARRMLLAGLTALVVAAVGAVPAGAYLTRFGTSFTPGGVEFPGGIAVDQATGDVYVAGYINGVLEKFSSAGVLEASFAAPSLATPWGVAVDESAGSSKVLWKSKSPHPLPKAMVGVKP